MRKYFISIVLFAVATTSVAAEKAISEHFNGKSGCFILYDVNHDKMVQRYNPERCAERIAPDSTFKIPLSVMAFDSQLISQDTLFKWDHVKRDLDFWNKDHTPKTWLTNSVVWVSRELTPKLGMKKIKHYLSDFNYGNQDFSGDPGKDNALTRAWMSSSLKLSADEQLEFLKHLLKNELPVSKAAMQNTKNNMVLETLPNGWTLYGKTGSGHDTKTNFLEGWFVGFVEKGGQQFIFVLNFTDLEGGSVEVGGLRAKKIVKELLSPPLPALWADLSH